MIFFLAVGVSSVLYFFIFPHHTYAQSQQFDLNTDSTFNVNDQGITQVTEKVKIVNKEEFLYSSSYSLGFASDVKNVRVFNQDGNIPFQIKTNKDNDSGDDTHKTIIEITFNNPIVGVGKVNEFTINYTSSGVATKRGDIWEIDIPGLSNPHDFSSYNVTVKIPAQFGEAQIIKPKKNDEHSLHEYKFTKNEIGSSGISLLFGKKQTYDYAITYHITNPNAYNIKTEIALPPDTSYQNTIIDTLIPPPINVYEDKDGNWLAIYMLSPNQKIDIKANGNIEVFPFSKQTLLSEEDKRTYTKSLKYWEANESEIKDLASKLATPKNIFNYVVHTLSYNYEKATGENARQGAKKALAQPNLSVCLEFTDLFIALARANGIPARSLEGYAYSQNSKLKPLSLVKDILHTWPEYYDSEKKTWIMVDPTWGNTTGGVDYFDSLDFEHVAFVVKGLDSTYPIPAGGYKYDLNSKDIDISIGNAKETHMNDDFQLSHDFKNAYSSGLSIHATVTVKNTGKRAITNKILSIKSELDPKEQQFTILSIPPFGYASVDAHFNKTPLLTNKDFTVTILFDQTSTKKEIKIYFIPDGVWLLLGGGTIAALVALLFITYKSWRLYLQR